VPSEVRTTAVRHFPGSAGVRVFRIASGAQVATIDPCTYGSGVDGLDFRPDGKTIAFAGDDGLVHLMDVESGQLVNRA
jgi:WD40 repeat protein